MNETSIPIQRLSLKKIGEEINPVIEKQETEDEKIAKLSGQAGWEALKERIQRKISSIEESTKIGSNTIGLIDDVQLYGFKCMAKDLLVEAYQSIINDVEMTAEFLKDKKNNNESKSKEKTE